MTTATVKEALVLEQLRSLSLRMHVSRSVETQVAMVKVGISLTRQLLELRARGVQIPDETIELALDACDEGVGRMIELMPPDGAQ